MPDASDPPGLHGKVALVTAAVAFLVSDAARNITGATLVADGGLLWTCSEQ